MKRQWQWSFSLSTREEIESPEGMIAGQSGWGSDSQAVYLRQCPLGWWADEEGIWHQPLIHACAGIQVHMDTHKWTHSHMNAYTTHTQQTLNTVRNWKEITFINLKVLALGLLMWVTFSLQSSQVNCLIAQKGWHVFCCLYVLFWCSSFLRWNFTSNCWWKLHEVTEMLSLNPHPDYLVKDLVRIPDWSFFFLTLNILTKF